MNRLPLFILVVQHLVLPSDDLLGSDVTHLQLAEVGEQLGTGNVLLCGPSVFLEPGLHIRLSLIHILSTLPKILSGLPANQFHPT